MNISADSSLTDLVSLARQVVKDLDHISVALSGGQDVLVKAREKAVAELSLFFVEVRRHEDIDLKVRQSCAEGIEELLDMYDCERAIKIIHRLPAAALAFGTIAVSASVHRPLQAPPILRRLVRPTVSFFLLD